MKRWLLGCVGVLVLAGWAWGATVTKQLIGSTVTVLTIELNNLAPNGVTLPSAVQDNRANAPTGGGGALLCNIEAFVTFTTTPDPDGGLAVWFQESIDESSYATAQIGNPKVVLPVNLVAPAVALRVVRQVTCPPGLFTVILKNDNTGAQLAPSGNTVKIQFVTLEGL
jgi:hypothetical protein